MLSRTRRTLKSFGGERRLFQGRASAISLCLYLLAFILTARLVWLQLYQGHWYRAQALQNHLARVPLPPRRGLVFDRHGVLLASNQPVFQLVIFPAQVLSLERTLAILRRLIRIDTPELQRFYREIRLHRPFESVMLRRRLTEKEAARLSLDRYRLPGVVVQARMLRYYPLGSTFASVLGYVGYVTEQERQTLHSGRQLNRKDIVGKIGVERFYEKWLHGTGGFQEMKVNVRGRAVQNLQPMPPLAGDNLYLTLDAGFQRAVQAALGRQAGAIVALDPRNGEVLALVSSPGFDPNRLLLQPLISAHYRSKGPVGGQALYNLAVQGSYPPGSVIKPFLAVGALEAGVVRSNFTIQDTGAFQVNPNGRIYHNIHQIAWGRTNFFKAITISSDIYFYTLGLKMGIERIAATLRAFGYGQATGIDIVGESGGLLPTRDWKRKALGEGWYPGDTVNVSIGQGFLLTTPLQMAAATSILAMSGQRWQPHVLLGRERAGGDFVAYTPRQLPGVTAHAKIWQFVHAAMQAVSTQGTAREYFLDANYSLASKTGTAQVVALKPDTPLHRLNANVRMRDHSLFIGFAPLEQPEIALAVVLQNSAIYAPSVGRKVLDYYFSHRSQIR